VLIRLNICVLASDISLDLDTLSEVPQQEKKKAINEPTIKPIEG